MNLSVKRALGIAMPAFAMATFSASPAQASTLQVVASADAATAALLDSAIAGEIRSPEEKARDIYRKPKETLSFFGLRPDMTVIEVSPGGGWWTDILARTARKGQAEDRDQHRYQWPGPAQHRRNIDPPRRKTGGVRQG